ncbi:DNA-processing protein DprA [Jiangella asiatica]|uniref:DNA-protecting protein DprA n=1 Tax=Jiangella asiatica TaxID=2530372 RepID=A0A4R5DTA1_9ACTN|nr:DNA-processing protein DprA [Jiangella asiatica]TDE14113.1 DNA-protecting protein DprA [Jiangella asiatica]
MSRDREARAALSAVVEPGEETVAVRLEEAGAVATWNAVRDGDDALDKTGLLRRRAVRVDGAGVLARAERLGIDFLCPGDPGWPAPLNAMAATMTFGADRVPPPFGLYVRGDVDLSGAVDHAVAIVGARNASRYGERVASDLAADLALSGWTVVSGAAFGIDGVAHRGALTVGGVTIAVLASGVDVPYPRGHTDLLDRIAASGVVVSEVPPGSRPMRSWFLARNRIIAALTAGTVVVEAAARSGALNTARWADKLSREVLAMPGPVTSALSVGCHDLVRDHGATLVTDARDVLDAVGQLAADAAPLRQGEERPFDRLLPVQRMVREHMSAEGPSSVDLLVRATGLEGARVRRALRELAIGGWVTQVPGGWCLGSRVP